jgi:hypothetical protein
LLRSQINRTHRIQEPTTHDGRAIAR